MGLDVPEMEDAYRPWKERAESGKVMDYGTSNLSYGDWWMKQKPAWQNSSTVGPTRARLINAELIDYKDIVDPNTGRLFTIKQLLRKHNIKD